MSKIVLFEHPLNEKMRTWLRIEFLLQQLQACANITDYLTALTFFRNISELLDVFERGELRTEMLKELERQQQKLLAWCDVPGVDTERVEALHLDQPLRDAQVASWMGSLDPLRQALFMILELIRQSGVFRHQTSLNGFYQDNAEGADLLRLQLTLEDNLYPQVSGHKTRYAIRFLPLDSERGEVPARLDFELACC